jgi:O-methyltransferase
MKALAKTILKKCDVIAGRASQNELVPRGNPRFRKSVKHLHNLVKDFVLPTLPDLDPARLDNLSDLAGLPVPQAFYLLDHLNRTLSLPGDVCEMGVAQGNTSRMLAHEIRQTDKNLWLFDSFQGLPAPTEEDKLIDDIHQLGDIRKYQGNMNCQRAWVEEKLAKISFPASRTRIIEGFFDDTTPATKTLPSQVCFAFVDFDFYKPIKDALEWLETSLVGGGTIIVHDYGFFSSGAQTAVDEFLAARKNTFTLSLPHSVAGNMAIISKTSS